MAFNHSCSFFFYVLEAVILYYPRLYWYEADYRWYLDASSYLVFFGVYWLIFQSINTLVGKYESQERESILTQQKKLWEEQLEEQKNAVSAARRHDLRHHYDTLLGMLSGGKTQEAVSYLNAQTRRMESAVLSDVCEHSAANAIQARWAARERRALLIPRKVITAWWNSPRKTAFSGLGFCFTYSVKPQNATKSRHLRQIFCNYATAGFRPWFSYIIQGEKSALRK